MIGILLSILKVIGIILLCILGFILAMILLVLFVPLRYQFSGEFHEKVSVRAKISWLFHIISFSISYEEQLGIKIRIFGIPLEFFQKLFAKKETKKAHTNMVHAPAPPDSPPTVQENTQAPAIEPVQNHHKKKADTKKTKNPFSRLCAWYDTIKKRLLEFLQTVRNILENIRVYIGILEEETTKQAFHTCKKRLGRLFKVILPKKCRINIVYGLENPADTGKILGLYGMLFPLIGKNVALQPDFEQQIFEGDFKGKGHIVVFLILYELLRVVTDKNCRHFIHLIKKGANQ